MRSKRIHTVSVQTGIPIDDEGCLTIDWNNGSEATKLVVKQAVRLVRDMDGTLTKLVEYGAVTVSFVPRNNPGNNRDDDIYCFCESNGKVAKCRSKNDLETELASHA